MAFVKLADNYTDLIGKFAVALLAEGVDRNILHNASKKVDHLSPSSRRAWIEIMCALATPPMRKCRPPRGGRG